MLKQNLKQKETTVLKIMIAGITCLSKAMNSGKNSS